MAKALGNGQAHMDWRDTIRLAWKRRCTINDAPGGHGIGSHGQRGRNRKHSSSKASLASCKWVSPRLTVHAPLLRVWEDRPCRLARHYYPPAYLYLPG
jgi:hypothetical protein